MYELSYKNKNHFSFGENWNSYLKNIDAERIKKARTSIEGFLGHPNYIKGKSFIDIGCGSGLFSLAAFQAGAKRVVSVDVDLKSIECTESIKISVDKPKNWDIMTGSILDKKFIKGLGKYDIVYSWGVLHHTGNMYQAIDNAISLVAPKGIFYLAIYNRFDIRWYGGTSNFWLRIKTLYNSVNPAGKSIMLYIYMLYQISVLIMFHRKNPFRYISEYKNDRGMSWKHDLIDWLGGLPYEFAGPDEIINYTGAKGFACKRLTFRNGIGCNEYLLVKN